MELKAESVSYVYDAGTSYSKKAVDSVDLTIHDNEFIGLIGHTGSGKSTLIQHLNGLLKPTSGRILYNGKDIFEKGYDRVKLRGHVGIVFQYPEYQLFEVNVLKDVAFGLKNLGFSDAEAESKAKEALALVGVGEEYYEVSPFELSGGQKRRVAIAGVLAMKPDVLILDEPTAGLDPRGREEILQTISTIRKDTQNTVILVSHSMDDVARYVDRIIVIDRGKIIYDDLPKEVFSHIKELEQMGLAAPQIYYIMRDLSQAGINVDTTATTIEEAKEEILKCLKI